MENSVPSYMDPYHERLERLQCYLNFAIDLSHATSGKVNMPWPLARAHQLYNRLTVSCMSIIKLLPHNSYFPTEWLFWDFFSVASLTRNFVENYFAFFYIGADKVSPEERDLRLQIFNYHENMEKYKVYRLFNAPPDELLEFEEGLPVAAEALRKHPEFRLLRKQAQEEIIKGKRFMYLNRSEIMNRLAFDCKEIDPLYKFFSNHTHSSPLSFYRMSNERGRGIENEAEVEYMTMAMDVVIKYLCAAIIDMIKIFPDAEPKLETEKLEIIKDEIKKS